MSTTTHLPGPTAEQPEPEVVAAPPEQAPAVQPAPDGQGRLRRWLGRALLGLGLVLALFLAYEFFFTGVYEARSQRALLPEFQQRLAEGGGFDSLTAPVPSGPVALLRIPSIGVRQVVVEGSSPEELKQGPGHLPGSVLPGEFGNSVIFAHRLTYGGPFSDLSTLKVGDEIHTVTGLGAFTYKVRKVGVVAPGENDVIGPALKSELTLVTSRTPGSSDRVAVTASLLGKPVGVPKRPQVAVGSDEQGTSGDPLGLLLAVLWAQVLLVLVLVANRLYHRWPRLAAHLVTTPAILVALWMVFQSLDRFLPGTM